MKKKLLFKNFEFAAPLNLAQISDMPFGAQMTSHFSHLPVYHILWIFIICFIYYKLKKLNIKKKYNFIYLNKILNDKWFLHYVIIKLYDF